MDMVFLLFSSLPLIYKPTLLLFHPQSIKLNNRLPCNNRSRVDPCKLNNNSLSQLSITSHDRSNKTAQQSITCTHQCVLIAKSPSIRAAGVTHGILEGRGRRIHFLDLGRHSQGVHFNGQFQGHFGCVLRLFRPRPKDTHTSQRWLSGGRAETVTGATDYRLSLDTLELLLLFLLLAHFNLLVRQVLSQ